MANSWLKYNPSLVNQTCSHQANMGWLVELQSLWPRSAMFVFGWMDEVLTVLSGEVWGYLVASLNCKYHVLLLFFFDNKYHVLRLVTITSPMTHLFIPYWSISLHSHRSLTTPRPFIFPSSLLFSQSSSESWCFPWQILTKALSPVPCAALHPRLRWSPVLGQRSCFLALSSIREPAGADWGQWLHQLL